MSHWTSRLNRTVRSVTWMTLTKTPFQEHSLKLLTLPQPPNVLNVQSAVGAPLLPPPPAPVLPLSTSRTACNSAVDASEQFRENAMPRHALPLPCAPRTGPRVVAWSLLTAALDGGNVLKSSRSLRPCKHLRERRWEALQVAL